MTSIEQKRLVGESAVEELSPGMTVGMGTGSTVQAFIDALVASWSAEQLQSCRYVSTSHQTTKALADVGIAVDAWEGGFPLDIAVDGADVITDDRQAIKGFGGALVRERVVFAASAVKVVLCDASKHRPTFGRCLHVPVEVIPFATDFVVRQLADLCSETPTLVRDTSGKPVVSDNGNHTLLGEFHHRDDARAVAVAVRAIPGVVDHGLFLDLVTRAYIGTANGVEVLA